MLAYFWPIALIVLTNTAYQICTKSVPEDMNPFATLTVTYLTGAAVSCALYYLLGKSPNILKEYGRLNWAPIVLGISIVGLEAGYIYAFRAGWQVSTAEVDQSTVLAAVLLFVGSLFYHEALTWNKIIGIAICVIGLLFINMN